MTMDMYHVLLSPSTFVITNRRINTFMFSDIFYFAGKCKFGAMIIHKNSGVSLARLKYNLHQYIMYGARS